MTRAPFTIAIAFVCITTAATQPPVPFDSPSVTTVGQQYDGRTVMNGKIVLFMVVGMVVSVQYRSVLECSELGKGRLMFVRPARAEDNGEFFGKLRCASSVEKERSKSTAEVGLSGRRIGESKASVRKHRYRKLRIPDNVDEQTMCDLELEFLSRRVPMRTWSRRT
jgi:hypothetical protein